MVVIRPILQPLNQSWEREKRGTSTAIHVENPSASYSYSKAVAHIHQKCTKQSELVFPPGTDLVRHRCRQSVQPLVIGGGFKNAQRLVLITRGHCVDLAPLMSEHEDADIRLLLYAKHASHERNRIAIQSPDTECGCPLRHTLQQPHVSEAMVSDWSPDKARYIPSRNLTHELGHELCNALLGFHVLTGCDSNSALSGLDKKNCFKVLLGSKEHQTSL